MQKINFLPQVKLWNAAEFASRPRWNDSCLGSMTYDGDADAFAVTLQGKNNPEWRYLLTATDTSIGVGSLRMYLDGSTTYTEVVPGAGSALSLVTGSLYDYSTNPLATMSDLNAAAGSIMGLQMDSSIIHTDSSYIHLKSDSSHPYSDAGDGAGAKVNPLATVEGVTAAITSAISALGNLFDLQGVYTKPYIPEGGSSITTFDDLLTYLIAHDPFDVKKGTVLIFGTEEYVLIDPNNYSTSDGWELLGSTAGSVISIGGQDGIILLSDSFYMNNKTLTLNAATDASLGGVKTGHSEGAVDSSTKYEFALKVGGTAVADTDKGYVSIPIVTGAAGDASYGIVPNAILSGNTRIYTVTLDPSTIGNLPVSYNNIKSILMTHNIGTDDLIISVYKVRSGNGDQRSGRQLVYVDEIISGPSSILIDFGSAEAFIGCQDQRNNAYLGYNVVIAASTSAINLNNDPSTSFSANPSSTPND